MDPNLECCVLGCHTKPNQGLRFYRFPCRNPQITSIWEQRICQSADFDILNGHVCELHFDYRCKTGNDCALEEGSLPTLYLPSRGTLLSTGNSHFQMSAKTIEEPTTISTDVLSYHCRFCLNRGLLYEVEASTYRSKFFLSLIDLPPNVLPNNTMPNAYLSCLKSIVIAHQLSMAVEHSNTILQLLEQHPKQSKVVSMNNFFNMKSELAFCNLILANSLSIKLEIEIEDNMVCANEDYEQKWVATGEPMYAYVNTQTVVEKSICIAEIEDTENTSDHYPKDFHKSFAIRAKYKPDLSDERILDMTENSDSDYNAEVMVWSNSDDYCAEDRQIDNEQAQESSSKAVNEPTCKCGLCKFSKNCKADLAIHKNLQLAGQTTFTTVDNNTHWNVDDDVNVCPTCDWKTPSQYSFNTHMGKHVKSDAKNNTIGSQELKTLKTDPVRNADGIYPCTECPKAFRNKSDFSRHERIHTNDRPYKCTECPKTFSQMGHFSEHKIIHTNERPYKCTECPKAFRFKSNFSVHKITHANERPYKCNECLKTFNTKSIFDTHKKIHANIRPYKCTQCPKTFNRKSSLDIHQIIHTNERPYQCTECSKTFNSKGNLGLHKRIHTNERPYKCTVCLKAFTTKSGLNVHKKICTLY